MRIISGNYGGRKLKAVPGMKTRPTTDKVKESMFNIIGPYFDGGVALDLFSGSGSLGIEAVSRGVDQAFLIDRQYQAIKTIHENVATTKEADKFVVVKSDAKKALKKFAANKQKFDYIFLDPPYKEQEIINLMQEFKELDLLQQNCLIICETDQDANLPTKIAGFSFIKSADYGITKLSFYENN